MPNLIVEDGTGVANANTYIDETYLTAYAEDRGFAIPSTAEEQQQFILLGMDYLSWFTEDFQGERTDSDNALPWPRKNVVLDQADIPSDQIPEQLKKALAQLVIEQQKRTLLFPKPRTSSVEGLVTEKKVGPLTKKFAFTGEGIASPVAPIKIMSVAVFLDRLLQGGTSRTLTTYRA